jgi:hypothetical protein
MSEPRADRRSWPAGLLGALVLIAAVESFVARHELDFTTPARMEWRQSRLAATDRAPACAVLGLGTSMSKLGVYPSVIERESGRRTFNLACCAGRIPGSYYLLRRALDAGARPEAILLEVHPAYLAWPFQEGMVAWPDLLAPADCLDLAWTARDASFFASTILSRALPSLNARAEIRAAVLASLRGEVYPNRLANSPLLRNLDRNAGAFVNRRGIAYDGVVGPYLEAIYLQPQWSCDKLNECYLRRLLDLCASKQIQVYWLIPPVIPSLQARREQMGNDGAYTRFTKRIQKEYPGVVVLDSRRSDYQPPVFFDAAHLDFPGAVTFSAEVGRILKTNLANRGEPGRWIDLPAYRDRVSDAPLEDLAQSSKAIADAANVRR